MNAAQLQTALYGALSGSATLVNRLSTQWPITPAIFADVPQVDGGDDAFFPYVVFGQDVITPWDTKTTLGGEATFQIDVWSRAGNYIEAKEIAQIIYDLLHYQSLTIDGTTSTLIMNESQNFSLDPDGETRRGLMLFRAMYDT
jgi:hypothetical protein